MKTNKLSCLTYLFIVLVLVIIDQYSKYVITSYLSLGESRTVIENFFWLNYVQNFGAGFSIMQNARTTFLIITPICLLLFVYLLYKAKDNLSKAALLLMIGGTIGNFIDRIINTYVIDFLSFNLFGWYFPVFNFADTFLTIGVILYIICLILEEKHAKV